MLRSLVGSEMCIRDSSRSIQGTAFSDQLQGQGISATSPYKLRLDDRPNSMSAQLPHPLLSFQKDNKIRPSLRHTDRCHHNRVPKEFHPVILKNRSRFLIEFRRCYAVVLHNSITTGRIASSCCCLYRQNLWRSHAESMWPTDSICSPQHLHNGLTISLSTSRLYLLVFKVPS